CIWALWTFAFAQSVYQLLASNPEFLTFRQITHVQLLEIIVVFNWAPAMLLLLVWAVLRRISRQFALIFLGLLYLCLFQIFFLELHKLYLAKRLTFHHNSLLAFVPGLLIGFVAFRHPTKLKSFLLVLTPVILLFPLWFLYRAWPETALNSQKN